MIQRNYIKNEIDRYWLYNYLSKKQGLNFSINQSADDYLERLGESDRKLLVSQINQAWRVRKFRQKNKPVTVSLDFETFRELEWGANDMGISIPELISKLIKKRDQKSKVAQEDRIK